MCGKKAYTALSHPPLRSKFTQTVVVPMVVYEIVIEAAGLG